jgi:hypothetical protein
MPALLLVYLQPPGNYRHRLTDPNHREVLVMIFAEWTQIFRGLVDTHELGFSIASWMAT